MLPVPPMPPEPWRRTTAGSLSLLPVGMRSSPAMVTCCPTFRPPKNSESLRVTDETGWSSKRATWALADTTTAARIVVAVASLIMCSLHGGTVEVIGSCHQQRAIIARQNHLCHALDSMIGTAREPT